ncbi:hypothetical protein [Nonomuraea sp. NPDC049646]|uniref:hypothetical protein n=1 Tax=unclassified Nonomuraea TaxID=2593643 RepID=UPI00378EA230
MTRPAAVPVLLQVGNITATIGAVELPLVAGPITHASPGLQFANFTVDHTEFRRSLADLLRNVADELDKGAVDG